VVRNGTVRIGILVATLLSMSINLPAHTSVNVEKSGFPRYLGRATSIIYGPTISVETDSIRERDSFEGKISVIHTLVTNPTRKPNYLLLCNRTLLELTPDTRVRVEPFRYIIRIDSGTAILHTYPPHRSSCYRFDTTAGRLRFASPGSVEVRVNGRHRYLLTGDTVDRRGLRPSGTNTWYRRHHRDAEYMFELIEDEGILFNTDTIILPSTQNPRLRHRSKNTGGVASYDDTQYFLANFLYALEYRQFRFGYDFWFAMSRSGSFFGDAWDEWRDLVDHINHVQLYRPSDPIFMRIGILERLTYGRGLLLHNYNNAVFMPFEKHNGIAFHIRSGGVRLHAFANDISKPRVMGAEFSWGNRRRTRWHIYYVGDIDQYSNLSDSDDDSYPDEIDPQPEIFNSPEDSVILKAEPQRLDELPARELHGIGFGFGHDYPVSHQTTLTIGGEAAILSEFGSGITFPNMNFGYRWFDVSVGLDFQTPRFIAQIFDRSYEHLKTRFVRRPDGGYDIVSIGERIEDTGEWLYGWNNSFGLEIPPYGRIRTYFRNIRRGDETDKNLSLSLETTHAITALRIRTSFFIEQNNVSTLLRKRTDGQSWGLQLTLSPHRTIKGRIRFRERYSDGNENQIIESDEVERNVTATVTVDGTYWWRKLLKWRENRSRSDNSADTM